MPTMIHKSGDVRVVDDSLVPLLQRDGYQVQGDEPKKPAPKKTTSKSASKD